MASGDTCQVIRADARAEAAALGSSARAKASALTGEANQALGRAKAEVSEAQRAVSDVQSTLRQIGSQRAATQQELDETFFLKCDESRARLTRSPPGTNPTYVTSSVLICTSLGVRWVLPSSP